MNVFARYGWTSGPWTMTATAIRAAPGTIPISRAASRIESRNLGRGAGDRPNQGDFYGASSGAIRAAAYAQAQPERVNRLALTAYTHKGTGAEEIARRVKRIDELRANRRKRATPA